MSLPTRQERKRFGKAARWWVSWLCDVAVGTVLPGQCGKRLQATGMLLRMVRLDGALSDWGLPLCRWRGAAVPCGCCVMSLSQGARGAWLLPTPRTEAVPKPALSIELPRQTNAPDLI